MRRQKLSSESGATILLALIFFLLCAMAGVVVLTAGSAASGRVAGIKQQQQAYYSVTSASEIIQEAIESNGFVYVMEEDESGKLTTDYIQIPTGDIGGQTGILTAATQQIMKQQQEGSAQDYTETLKIYPANAKDKEKLGVVTCVFTMHSDYSVEIVLRLADVKDENNYVCTMTAQATKRETVTNVEKTTEAENKKETVTKTEIQVTWTSCTIDKR